MHEFQEGPGRLAAVMERSWSVAERVEDGRGPRHCPQLPVSLCPITAQPQELPAPVLSTRPSSSPAAWLLPSLLPRQLTSCLTL